MFWLVSCFDCGYGLGCRCSAIAALGGRERLARSVHFLFFSRLLTVAYFRCCGCAFLLTLEVCAFLVWVGFYVAYRFCVFLSIWFACFLACTLKA